VVIRDRPHSLRGSLFERIRGYASPYPRHLEAAELHRLPPDADDRRHHHRDHPLSSHRGRRDEWRRPRCRIVMSGTESSWVIALATGFTAAALMLVATPLVIRLARRMDWMAHPKEDRWHKQSTALMGGIAIFAAAILAYLLFGWNTETAPLWAGGAIMFTTGLVDDIRSVRPATKLVAQV